MTWEQHVIALQEVFSIFRVASLTARPSKCLIQGEIEAPKIKYCLNQENWKKAQGLFNGFLNS